MYLSPSGARPSFTSWCARQMSSRPVVRRTYSVAQAALRNRNAEGQDSRITQSRNPLKP